MKTLSHKLIITKVPYVSRYAADDQTKTLSVLMNNKECMEISCDIEEERSLIGNIYVGKVKNIVKNIDAAFVEIKKGVLCFLPLSEAEGAIFTTPKNNAKIVVGDELLVQVLKDGVKTKAPVVSTNLNFTGRYFVFTTKRKDELGISNKLGEEDRKRLQEYAQKKADESFGMIIRTNAKNASEEELNNEYAYLKEVHDRVVNYGIHKTAFSLLMQDEAPYIKQLRNMRQDELDEIITDDKEIYEQAHEFLKAHQPGDLDKLRFYSDESYSLWKLYGLETILDDAIRTRVWLKSGGYLIIEPTEALTVVDVNTGKYDGNKNAEATFVKINQEAAAETAKQLRLRNISGIIIIDFIDMKTEADKLDVLSTLNSELKKDPVKATLVDMTKLNLAEVTRKKVKKSLREQLGSYDYHRN
ncbi:MAG: ribonuclease E/G [Lachnospiraceae bacterium]|nr:ribonuclease E/G [Lachnospiraceae bacterium]